MLRNLLKSKPNRIFFQNYRAFAAQAAAEPKTSSRLPEEWDQAKPFSAIPGPSFLQMAKWFSKGGKLYGKNLTEIHGIMRDEFGNLAKFKGMFGRDDIIMLFKPEDFETTFRTETVWPVRNGMDAFIYYRKNVRKDLFKGIGGLVTENGQAWHDFRSVVNPVMMQPKTTKVYIPKIDEIAKEFVEIMKKFRDSNSETPANYGEYVNRWSLESISCIALDTRLKVMDDATQDANAKAMIKIIRDFFDQTFAVEIMPSPWKYFATPTFKKLMATSDVLTNIVVKYVEDAMERLEKNPTPNENEQGVLERLMKIDKHTAKVMALDMLLAGVDTTGSALIGVIYSLAKNPEKQEKLRAEIKQVLPEKSSPLTADNMRNMPYLRAVIKEALRMLPPASGTIRAAGQDLVIQGYQIPQGSNLLVSNALLSMQEEHFPRSNEFLPERWIRENVDSGCPNARNANPFVYLPFGFGARMCVGRRMAEMEIEVLVARMVREFQIGWHHAPLKYKSTLLNVPDGDIRFRLEEIN